MADDPREDDPAQFAADGTDVPQHAVLSEDEQLAYLAAQGWTADGPSS